MTDSNNKITIGFSFTDESGNSFSANSAVEYFSELGDTPLSCMFEQFNAFLNQCGFLRRNGYIFEQDITSEEYDAIDEFLTKFRKEAEK